MRPSCRFLFSALALAFATLPAADSRAGESLHGFFELRTYHVAEGKLEALHRRFRDHTLALFEKHGMSNVAYWVPQDDEGQRLVFLLAYPDREARERSWAAFLDDPEWQQAYAESHREGELVASAESLFLLPTDYSPGLPPSLDTGAPRQFEMRTYTTLPGKLGDIDARFRDHTIALFEKHGMTHLPYFHLAPGQEGAETILLYFLVHESDDTRKASFDAFRQDPAWIEAREASESEGPILIQGGVESLLLKATDYSPLK